MFDLITSQPLRFIIALLIGLATAWWIWARYNKATDFGLATAEPDNQYRHEDAQPLATAPQVSISDELAQPVAGLLSANLADGALPQIAQAIGPDDDLLMIKGIGPKLNELVLSLGIRRFDQIAAWSAADVAEVDGYLDNFRGRIVREEWVEQAKLLASGQLDEFSARFG